MDIGMERLGAVVQVPAQRALMMGGQIVNHALPYIPGAVKAPFRMFERVGHEAAGFVLRPNLYVDTLIGDSCDMQTRQMGERSLCAWTIGMLKIPPEARSEVDGDRLHKAMSGLLSLPDFSVYKMDFEPEDAELLRLHLQELQKPTQ